MFTLRAFPFLAAWCAGVLVQAQVTTLTAPAQTRPVEKHQVTGTVVNSATGEPLRRVLVTLDFQNTAFTDGAGRFTIENVPDGQYSLQCRKPGFFAPNEQGGSWSPGPQITVSATAEPFTLKLIPAASITGRVVDTQGQPIENASVQVSSNLIVNGRRRWQMSNSANSDEDGNYEIENLQPGTYRLRLGMNTAAPFAPPAGNLRAKLPVEVYPAQYYPQGSDESAAQAIVLTAGQKEQADFTARAEPGFRVRGTVAPTGPGTFIRVEDGQGNDAGIGAVVNVRTGGWVIPALPSGTWKIIAVSNGQQEQLSGEQIISVNGADVANVQLLLLPFSAIPVQISNPVEGNVSNLQLRLLADQGWQQNEYQAFNSPAAPNSGGNVSALSLANVPPGHYGLRAQVFGTGCVESVHYAGTEVGREGLTISANAARTPIEVTLRDDCGSIQVRLNKPSGTKSAAVLLLSDNPTVDPVVQTTMGDGPITLSNLTPGSYRLYAFDDINNLEYENPESMRSFSARELTLDSKQNAEITLDLNERNNDRRTSNVTP